MPRCFFALLLFVFGLVVMLSSSEREASAQPKAPVITPAPQAPILTTPASLGAKPGGEVELTLTGTNLTDPTAVLLTCPAKATIPTDAKNGSESGKLRVLVKVDPKCEPGLYLLRVATKNGISNARPFVVDTFPQVASTAANRTKETALAVETPAVASGVIAPETSEFFKVKVSANQKLTFEVLARRIGSPLDPVILIHDSKTKRELAELYTDDTPGLQGDCRITHTFKEAGEVVVEVRDTTHRGGNDFAYRLRVGEYLGATTAFPLVVERSKAVSIGFAGPETIPAVEQSAPKDPALAAFNVAPKLGWPLPVLLSDHPQMVEEEPNDELAKANRLPVPGGVSAKFDKARDVDHFAISGKKGQKLIITTQTFEVNSPAEVLVRVLDAKGGQLAASNPAAPVNRFEFTPGADGEYIIACEHQNYLHGPDEVYHLSVVSAAPDISVALAFDRAEAPAGGGTGVFVNIARLNGYNGAVDLSIDGGEALSGSFTLPAGQSLAYVPLLVKEGTKPGAYPFRVKAVAMVGGTAITRYGMLTDPIKQSLGGMPNPPPDLLTTCALAVIEGQALSLKLSTDEKSSKILVEATRGGGADGDIVLTPLFFPTPAPPPVKPIAKGQTVGEIPLAASPIKPAVYVFRATTKIGGKDYSITLPPLVIETTEPKKEEPKKKEAPKDDKK